MPRITPQSWKTLVKVFKKLGFVEERQSGDHICMSKPGVDRPIVIPKYPNVGIDIIKNNMKTAGIDRDEYLDILSKV